MTTSSILDIIANSIGNYGNEDPEWERFIIDHKSYLLENSETRIPTVAYMRPYQKQLKHYLNSIKYNQSAEWIVRLLNGFTTDMDFVDIRSIIIPNITIIKKLYALYRTNQANTSTRS